VSIHVKGEHLSAVPEMFFELNMPLTSNRDVRIHYEVEGKGHPLVLQHGFSDNIQEWYDL